MISNSLEEYLKVIYILKINNGNIRVTDIAEKMNCSKASVNKAINHLKEHGLINYETYGTIEITNAGEIYARKILEAYDIVYVFLRDVLNIEDSKAKDEAEKIKQSVSDDTLNTLAKYTHKVLGLNNLECNYDIKNERCVQCSRRKLNIERKII